MEYVTNFFEIASPQSMLIIFASIAAGIVAVIEIFQKKGIIRNVIWLAVCLFFFKQGLGYYSEDIKVSSFAKYFKSELQDALDIKIEKIVIEKSASSNEHKVHLYGAIFLPRRTVRCVR